MLELRPNCERCDADLPPDSDARICSFECTFCVDCADAALGGACPNCGGELVKRPIRPAALLDKYPGERGAGVAEKRLAEIEAREIHETALSEIRAAFGVCHSNVEFTKGDIIPDFIAHREHLVDEHEEIKDGPSTCKNESK